MSVATCALDLLEELHEAPRPLEALGRCLPQALLDLARDGSPRPWLRARLQRHWTQPEVRRSGHEVPIAAVHLTQPGVCGARQMQRIGSSQEDVAR